MTPRFERRYPPACCSDGPVWRVPFDSNGNLLRSGLQLAPDRGERTDVPSDALYIGDWEGSPVLAWKTADFTDNDQLGMPNSVDLRGVVANFPSEWATVVGYAFQLLEFRRRFRFCTQCGSELIPGEMWSRSCVSCKEQFWPPVSPAVLLLIHDEDGRILLAQKPGWGDRWSILAGFVEPGESLEECCFRESVEEVGVEIEEPIYVGSQPWPFPHQLMVAFTARYRSGSIVPDPGELADARWFPKDDLPKLPPPHALSRQTIDHFLRNVQ
ncbi:MAG: NAD(+) diphosphatase [Armatimonadaceae bacterium]|jgi:NAD+ diphosphatase